MSQKTIAQIEGFLKAMEKRWPKPLPKEVLRLFERTRHSLQTLKKEKPSGKFSFIKLIQQVLKTHDILFLNRRLSYHVVATSDLPMAYGREEEALIVLSEMLSTTTRHLSVGSRLEIRLEEVQVREGPSVQAKFVFEGKALSDLERQTLLENIYGSTTKGVEQEGEMSSAKHILKLVGGRFWLEFPKETQVSLTFHWPAFKPTFKPSPSHYGTYKYDIFLADYNRVRQRFGIAKAKNLVTQIENFSKSLVRYPLDMVIGFPDRGIVTTIYESQEGTASSVAARISQKLSKEPFRIGKKALNPKFRYQLTFLA